MIKAKLSNGDVFLGVDRENINRLTDGKPIHINGSDLGVDHDIYVVFGENLNEIIDQYGLPKIQ